MSGTVYLNTEDGFPSFNPTVTETPRPTISRASDHLHAQEAITVKRGTQQEVGGEEGTEAAEVEQQERRVGLGWGY